MINGYGRIGRLLHRMTWADKSLNIAAINSRATAENHAYLLKYDSTYGKFDQGVTFTENTLSVNGQVTKVFIDKNPGDIDLKRENIDVVIECTGKFKDRASCELQLKAGAKKVIISAPGKGEDICIVVGVNSKKYEPKKHHIISNASCTTNCLAPVVATLDREFGLTHAFMTTIHAVTRSQTPVDASSDKDLRKGRGFVDSFIPTTTGSDSAIGMIFPHLDGKIKATAVRVPFSTVSLIDLVGKLKKKVDETTVNKAFEKAGKTYLKGILGISYEPLVSVDYKKDERSAIIDALSTTVLSGDSVKVFAWYDNEWAYTKRLYDLTKLVASQM